MLVMLAVLYLVSLPSSGVTLDQPSGVLFDRQGRLIVADTGNDRILVFGPDLELRAAVGGSEGGGEGLFNRPHDIAELPDGRCVVADTGRHKMQVFSPEWDLLYAFGGKGDRDGEFNYPADVSADSRGRIIVTDRFNHRLQVFSSAGKHLFTFGNREGEKPKERIAWEKSRGDGKKEPNPVWQRTDTGQLNEPGGVFLDEKLGRLFVANGWNCRIEQLDYDLDTGRISRRAEEDRDGIVWGFWITRGLAGDHEGRILGLQSAFGEIKIFEDRGCLYNESKPAKVLKGGGFGRMKDLRDIAVSESGEVAVADAANNRIVLIPKDLTFPEDVRVREVAGDGAAISWRTREPCRTEALIRAGDLPERTPSRPDPWHDGTDRLWKLEAMDKTPCRLHEMRIGGLEPGRKYFYKVRLPEARTIPDPGWSREYAINTPGKPGETEYLALTLKVLLLPNVLHLPSIEEGAPFPEPMLEEDYERLYWASFREAQLFYWTNSRMKLFIDFDLYVDPAFYRKGEAPEGILERFKELPGQNHDLSFRNVLERAGAKDKVYFGQLICECERRWNKQRGEWIYQGSGGGTYGIEWPIPGRTHFLGGSDTAWLFTHEYKHQLESNCDQSGMTREDDRMWFCHFSPAYPGWEQDTAADHGEHWDGIAWQLRHMTDDQYRRLIYADLRTARDADHDGIPDRAPGLPLDEARFGSHPDSQDSDGDGLSDMEEVLASTWVTCLNAPVRSRIGLPYIRPDPMNPDSDGDGIEDGRDAYPIYPFKTRTPRLDIEVDGRLEEWPEAPDAWLEGFDQRVEVRKAWSDDRLYLALAIEGDTPLVRVVLDMLADGFYVGNDNLYFWIKAEPGKEPALRDAKLHLCGMGRWPFFDTRDEGTGKNQYFDPEELLFASRLDGAKRIVEIGVPKRELHGLFLKPQERIGLMLYVEVPGKGPVSLTEPWSIFDFELTE